MKKKQENYKVTAEIKKDAAWSLFSSAIDKLCKKLLCDYIIDSFDETVALALLN